MKILVFSPYYPPHVGGVENYVQEFSEEMVKRGHALSIFTPNLPFSHASETETGSLTIIRFPAFEIIPGYPLPRFWKWQFWQQLQRLMRPRPDIVISQTRFFFTSLLALVSARAKSIPHVHVEHGSGFVSVSGQVTTALAFVYDHTFGKLIFRWADTTVCISRAVSRFVSRFDTRPACIIYRGMDFAALDAAAADTELKRRFEGKLLLVSVARLSHWKGIDHTISAIKQLSPTERERIVLLIIGDGEERARLKKLAQPDLPVHFLGSVPRERVFSILKSVDIYIHSARVGGGLSTALLEALYAQCAVIASPHEGADEVIEDHKNGLLLKGSSPEGICQAMQLFLRDPELLSRLKEKSRTSVLKQFSWTTAGDQFTSVFRHLRNQ